MIFYIADIHFYDSKVFQKCSRPFDNFDDYAEEIIFRWNSKVKNDDIVYVLGDIAEDDSINCLSMFNKMNGHKHLIIGNHDSKIVKEKEINSVFESISFIKLINDNGRKVCLCHYPLMDWIEFNRDGYLVYGHIHNKSEKNNIAYKQIKEYYADKKAYNAGVDVTNFEPVTLDEMIKLKEANKNEPYIN